MDKGPKYNHGFPESDWRLAKGQARAAMIKRAKRGATMTYTDLCNEISALPFAPHDQRLAHFLGEISTEEDANGRGLLTAVVVHKHDGWPGPGFFDLARSLGRTVTDEEKMWIDEITKLRRVHG
jgi:hypothetical protein